jgi:hypothetical protein
MISDCHILRDIAGYCQRSRRIAQDSGRSQRSWAVEFLRKTNLGRSFYRDLAGLVQLGYSIDRARLRVTANDVWLT